MPIHQRFDSALRVPALGAAAAAIASVLGASLPGKSDAALICIAPGCIIDENVTVGSLGSGNGLLVVSAPTTVSVGGAGAIGTDGPDRGDVTVTGPGALLEVGGDTSSRLHIGFNGGTGTLNVLDNATVSARARDAGDAVEHLITLIGAGGNGSAEVSSGGTLLVQDQFNQIGPGEFAGLGVGTSFQGLDGIGSLRVDGDGSEVLVDGYSAVLTVGAASNVLTGGGAGRGSLEVLNGADININARENLAQWHVGAGGNAVGTATVAGVGSEVNISGVTGAQVLLGGDGADAQGVTGVGTLHVTDQGRVTVDASEAEADVIVGHGLGTGLLQVDGGGEVTIDGNLRISANNDVSGNDQQSGVMLIHDTGIVTTTGTTYIGNGTSPSLNGYLCGTGTLITDAIIVQTGGVLCPGFSPGTLNIVGDLILDGGLLEVEIAGFGAGMFDSLNVAGLVDLTNANILFRFLDGFLPGAGGGAFDFITAGSIVNFASANFFYENAPDGFSFDFIERNGVITAAVPAPGSLVLLATGVLALVSAGFRRRAITAPPTRPRPLELGALVPQIAASHR